jgi:peptide/nickel transport system permease protein
VTATVDVALPPASPPARPGSRRRLPRSALLTVGLIVLAIVVLMAVFAPLLTKWDPGNPSAGAALERPSARHWLGTDRPGRDIFAQVVYGARASLTVAVLAGSLAMAGAVALGVLPALVGGTADRASNRLVTFLLALPGAPLLVLIGSLTLNSRVAVILVIALLGAPPNARTLRGQALTLRERGFVASARGFGGGPLYVLRRHFVPGLAPLIVVGFVNWASVAVGLEAGLTFLGLGDPSGISWGLMLNRALGQPNIYTSSMWVWWVLPAGLLLTVTLLALTIVGVALEPVFNPRSQTAL